MASLELDLLGGFDVRAGGSSIEVAGRKERALLAVLALVPGERRSRDKLAGLLWSDRGEKQAHDSLKSALARIKKALRFLEFQPIVASRESVALNRNEIAVDVGSFERLIADRTPESLAKAATLYRGDFLDNCDVRDPVFEEWLLIERQRLRHLACDALAILLDHYVTAGDRDSAIASAHRLLALDPLWESAHRALMWIHAEQGQPLLALKQYGLCCETLQRELGVKPEFETDRLYRSIQEKRATIQPIGEEVKITPASNNGSVAGLDSKPIPLKPIVAVFPFANMSGAPEQQYLSDGITEDIITELSRFHSLQIIGRSSSFRYRDHAVDAGRELGARYVVEGSVRRTGNVIRIGVQLVDAESEIHLWAERYDRDMREVFAIQDDAVRMIVVRLVGQVEAAGRDIVRRKRTENLAAYDCLLRGLEHLSRNGSEDIEPARLMFQKAISIDPTYAQAHAALAVTLSFVYWASAYETKDADSELDMALEAATRAIALDPSDAVCHRAFAHVHLSRRSFELAEYHFAMAAKLNPSDPDIAGYQAWFEICMDRPAAALARLDEMQRLNPYPPNWYWELRGLALYHGGHYGDAANAFTRVNPPAEYSALYCAACHAQMGDMARAQANAEQALASLPRFTLRRYAQVEPYASTAALDRLIEGMRKAGLPD